MGQSSGSCHSCVTPRQASSSLPEPQHATPRSQEVGLGFSLKPLPISHFLPHIPTSLCSFRLQASPTPTPSPTPLPSSRLSSRNLSCYLTRSGRGWIEGCLFPQDRSPSPCGSPRLACCLGRAAGHSHGEKILRMATRASPA